MNENYKVISEYLITNEKLNIENLVVSKEKSEIATQLNQLKNEKLPEIQSKIIQQLFHNQKKYLRFNRREVEEGRIIYIFSVLTVQLAEFDRAYFEGKFRVEAEEISLYDNTEERVIDTLYKPYYCEAVIELNENEDREKRKIIEEGINGEWNLIREYDEPTNNSFPIAIHFCASPFMIKKMYAEWYTVLEKKGEKQLVSVLDKFEGKDLNYIGQPDGKEKFDDLFRNVDKSCVHVLRVGQASANYCFTIEPNRKNTHKYYFDVGLPTDWNMLTGDGLKFLEDKIVRGYFEKNGPEAVILSHWHSDHVKGAFTMKDVASMVWLAPVFKVRRKTNPESINRLGSYIFSKKKLASIQVNQNPIYTCGNFALYHGVGSKLNDKGFMLQLNSTLLPGDCQFDFWPQGFGFANTKSQYTNLVFPHHGADMNDKNNRIDCLKNNGNTKVIIPTGYNHYGHPADNCNIFNGKNYTVFPTNPISKKSNKSNSTNKKSNKTNSSIFTNYFNLYVNARSDIVHRTNTPLTKTENKEFSIVDKP